MVTDVLNRLSSALPPSIEAAAGEDMDLRSRAVLSYVVERALACRVFPSPIPSDPVTCPNCGGPSDSGRSPYCGTFCREEAAFVRQLRSGLSEETVFDPERQAALGQKLWHLLGGGYPRRQALILPKAFQRILERDGKCTVCGAPATTIDHTGSG